MKWMIDGNMLCVVDDNFTNLQESDAVFISLDTEEAKLAQEQLKEFKYEVSYEKKVQDDIQSFLKASKVWGTDGDKELH